MADTQTYNWDEVNVDETLSKADHEGAADLSNSTPVGKLLVTIVESKAVEKTFKEYSCIAANLKMRIDSVLEIEKPVIDDKGQPLKRNGEPVMKRQPIADDEKAKADMLYCGRFVFDDVNLHNQKEKEAMKKRRIFIANKVGIITGDTAKITGAMWGKDIIGKQAVVTTEWNAWEDKVTKEIKRNVKVAWDGYDFAETAGNPADDDFSQI